MIEFRWRKVSDHDVRADKDQSAVKVHDSVYSSPYFAVLQWRELIAVYKTVPHGTPAGEYTDWHDVPVDGE